VTGLGIVSVIGIVREVIWGNLHLGKSGLSQTPSFEIQELKHRIAIEISQCSLCEFESSEALKKLGRALQYTIDARNGYYCWYNRIFKLVLKCRCFEKFKIGFNLK
jgi:3-oxoacyl-(acyl-carrier-protein) synthase